MSTKRLRAAPGSRVDLTMAKSVSIRGLTQHVSRQKKRRTLMRKGSSVEVKEGAEELAYVAGLMAPRRSGTLESSITMGEESISGGGNIISREVFIDSSKRTPRDSSVEVYADIQHEFLEPASNSLKLGRDSELKNDGNPYEVGGGFMTRAAEEANPTIIRRFRNRVRQVLRF